MSWNPFKSHTGTRISVLTRQEEREFEKEVKRLEELDEACKKLYKDGKRYVEASNSLAKSEHKLVQDLLNSGLCQTEEQFQHNIGIWKESLEKLERYRQEQNSTIQKTVLEPTKKFSGVFPSVQSAIKKREQSLQEYNKYKVRAKKYLDKERTGQNIVKADTNKKALEVAKEDFENQNDALRQDLPKFYEGRIDYFKPSFDSLLRSQLTYNAEAFKTYAEVSSELFQHSKLSEQERKTRMTQTLSEIKALSITGDI